MTDKWFMQDPKLSENIDDWKTSKISNNEVINIFNQPVMIGDILPHKAKKVVLETIPISEIVKIGLD